MKKITRLLSVLLCIFCAMGCGSVKDRESKASIPQTSLGMYAYECLKDKEKAVYDAMVYALNNHIEKIEVETIDDEAPKRRVQAPEGRRTTAPKYNVVKENSKSAE